MTMKNEAFEPTPAAVWVDPFPRQEVTLPSGNKAVIKKPNIYILGKRGKVPKGVTEAQMRRAKRAAEKIEVTNERALAELEDMEVYVDWAMTRAFISPRVVQKGAPGPDEIHVSQLTSDDKAFVVETVGIEI